MGDGRARRWWTAAVVLALVAVIAPVGVGAQERPTLYRVVGRASFTRDGVAYGVRLEAYRRSLSVTISRVRDPDGDGPRLSRQHHRYGFTPGSRVVTETSNGASITATDGMAPWGRVAMDFAPRGEEFEGPYCEIRQRGRLRGVLRLRTHTAFGRVVVSRMRAVLVRIDPNCAIAVSPVPTCPRAAWTASARHPGPHRTTAITQPHRDRAWIETTRGGALGMRHPDSKGWVQREVEVRTEAARVSFDGDLSQVVVRGAPGTDVRRRMVFEADGPIRTTRAWCAPGRENVLRRRAGGVTGTLIIDFFIGADRDFSGRRLAAGVSHSRNRITE